MANGRAGNVQFVDTTADFDDVKQIRSIKYIGAAASSVTIKSKDASGQTVWEESDTVNKFEEVNIDDMDGVYVTVTGTAKVYIYMK